MKKTSRIQSSLLHTLVSIAAVILVVAGGSFIRNIFSVPQALADSSEHNVSGYLYSANVGWISMSCNNTTGGCGTVYGVNVDLDNGDVSGTAFSQHVGWINFGSTSCGTPQMDPLTGTFSGSAQVVSAAQFPDQAGGWEGCLRLSGTNYGVIANVLNGTVSGYGWDGNDVGLDTTNASQFEGYDGNTDVGLGWVDFSAMTIETEDLGGTVTIGVTCPAGSENSGFDFSAGFTDELAMQDGNVECAFTGDLNTQFNVTGVNTDIEISVDDLDTYSFGLTCTNTLTNYSETVPVNDSYTFNCGDPNNGNGQNTLAPVILNCPNPASLAITYAFEIPEDVLNDSNNTCSYVVDGSVFGVVSNPPSSNTNINFADQGGSLQNHNISVVCVDENGLEIPLNPVQEYNLSCNNETVETTYECSDGIDNDLSDGIDGADASCYENCNPNGVYNSQWDDESSTCSPSEESFCSRPENINNPNCVGQAPIIREN